MRTCRIMAVGNSYEPIFDVAIIGAGMAGMATAARLQAAGLSSIVLEAHGLPGGCAGYYRRAGFSFDVGATTLVDFAPGGVGGELLESIGLAPLAGEQVPGYQAWLPDRQVTLHRDPERWAIERIARLGATPTHRAFWALLDELAQVFWAASRRGVRLPLRNPRDAILAARAVGLANLPLTRYLDWTMGRALRSFGLREDRPLVGLLSMLIEDTVHSTVDDAPLINAALGITIRGAGLTRARGGMRGFWRKFVACYRALGGDLRLACPVLRIEGRRGGFVCHTPRGIVRAANVVSAVPAVMASRLGPAPITDSLKPYLVRDAQAQGGAVVVCMGVPEHEVAGHSFTHHQLLQDYDQPLGNGNNMFISVSAPGDDASAPAGSRAVMISTHCELDAWQDLSDEQYMEARNAIGERLVTLARRVYPELGRQAVVCEVATPRTYERYTGRPRGAVGGLRLSPRNANQHAIPHQLGLPGYWLVGDTTWPGLGTVACVLGSRIVAEQVLKGTASVDVPRGLDLTRKWMPHAAHLG
jgi:C-3',4' desaturase CrtD